MDLEGKRANMLPPQVIVEIKVNGKFQDIVGYRIPMRCVRILYEE